MTVDDKIKEAVGLVSAGLIVIGLVVIAYLVALAVAS